MVSISNCEKFIGHPVPSREIGELGHIKEVKETKDVKEVNKLVKEDWELLEAGPSGEKDWDKDWDQDVLFILGRS